MQLLSHYLFCFCKTLCINAVLPPGIFFNRYFSLIPPKATDLSLDIFQKLVSAGVSLREVDVDNCGSCISSIPSSFDAQSFLRGACYSRWFSGCGLGVLVWFRFGRISEKGGDRKYMEKM